MGDLRSRLEAQTLARQLGVDAGELAFLEESPPEDLRDLRALVSAAIAHRHADLTHRLVGLSRLLPVAVTARIAEGALGPVLSARIAGALEPHDAARLVTHVDPAFLAEVAAHLDAARVAPLVAELPIDLVVGTGQRMLAAGEDVGLGRLVAVVDTDVALRVVAEASPAQLLRVVLHTEDLDALARVVESLDDDRVAALVAVAGEDATGETRAALLAQLGALSPAARARLEAAAG